jgi:hypothetical protein
MNDAALVIILALMVGEVWLFIECRSLQKEIDEIKRRYKVDTPKNPPAKTMDEIIEENLRPDD